MWQISFLNKCFLQNQFVTNFEEVIAKNRFSSFSTFSNNCPFNFSLYSNNKRSNKLNQDFTYDEEYTGCWNNWISDKSHKRPRWIRRNCDRVRRGHPTRLLVNGGFLKVKALQYVSMNERSSWKVDLGLLSKCHNARTCISCTIHRFFEVCRVMVKCKEGYNLMYYFVIAVHI